MDDHRSGRRGFTIDLAVCCGRARKLNVCVVQVRGGLGDHGQRNKAWLAWRGRIRVLLCGAEGFMVAFIVVVVHLLMSVFIRGLSYIPH